MRAIEDIKQDIKLQERAISYLASVGCDDDAMMSDRRLDYLKTELEFAEKCKECKKKREPLELKWIPIAEELPEKNSNVLVYVQNTRGGFIRGDGYITVATFVPTMIDKYYFNFHGEGLVTIARIAVSDNVEEVVAQLGFAIDRLSLLAYSRIKEIENKKDILC